MKAGYTVFFKWLQKLNSPWLVDVQHRNEPSGDDV